MRLSYVFFALFFLSISCTKTPSKNSTNATSSSVDSSSLFGVSSTSDEGVAVLHYLNSNDTSASVLVQAGLSNTLANRIRDRKNVTKGKMRFWDLEKEMNGLFQESDMKNLVKAVIDNGMLAKAREIRIAAEKASADKASTEKAAADLKKQKDSGIPVPPPVTPAFEMNSDPYNPTTCQGEPLTLEEAKNAFQSGALMANLGNYVVHRRERTCNAISGCGEWSKSTTFIESSNGSMTNNLELKGNIILKIQDDKIQLKLFNGGIPNSGTSCSSIPSKEITCGGYYYSSGSQWGGSGGTYSTENQTGEFTKMTGVLTSRCLQLKATEKYMGKDREYAIIGAVGRGVPIGKSACEPGTTQMECGGQAASKLTTCCRSGTTTCPSRGCDCFSSCN